MYLYRYMDVYIHIWMYTIVIVMDFVSCMYNIVAIVMDVICISSGSSTVRRVCGQHVYVYIYIYIYIFIYLYIFIYTHMYIHLCIYIYICVPRPRGTAARPAGARAARARASSSGPPSS